MRDFGKNRAADCGSFIVDRRGTILAFDQAMERLTGWPAVEIVGRNKTLGRTMLRTEDGSAMRLAPPLYEGEIAMVRSSKTVGLTLHGRDGRRYEADTVVRRLPGPGERMMVTTLRVLSQSPRKNGAEAAARRDTLTGLFNLDAFHSRLSESLGHATAAAQPLALVLADVDHLRRVNDNVGHHAGDEVLKKLAGILRVSIDDESTLFRLGDDDFAILLPGAGRGDARQLAAGLRSTVERYKFLPGQDQQITLSLGAASYPADSENDRDLLDRARDALNEAREMGRNRVWCYLRRPRVPVQVPVFFDGAEALLVGYTRDLSPSGIFVQTSAPVDVGMRCALNFPLPGCESKVHVIGRVVRTVPPEVSEEHQEVRIPGMGVEFERFGGSNDRRVIETFLHANEADTLRPENGRFSVT